MSSFEKITASPEALGNLEIEIHPDMSCTMTRTEFEAWAREAEELRDQALKKYRDTWSVEIREAIIKELGIRLNQV